MHAAAPCCALERRSHARRLCVACCALRRAGQGAGTTGSVPWTGNSFCALRSPVSHCLRRTCIASAWDYFLLRCRTGRLLRLKGAAEVRSCCLPRCCASCRPLLSCMAAAWRCRSLHCCVSCRALLPCTAAALHCHLLRCCMSCHLLLTCMAAAGSCRSLQSRTSCLPRLTPTTAA